MATVIAFLLVALAGGRWAAPWHVLAELRDDARYEADRPELESWLAAIHDSAVAA